MSRLSDDQSKVLDIHGTVHFAFKVADVKTAIKEIRAKGVEIAMTPIENPGMVFSFIRDNSRTALSRYSIKIKNIINCVSKEKEIMEKTKLEKLFVDRGFSEFKWIKAKDIVVSQWVRFRCMFGCPAYGKRGTCPPNVPSIDDCRQMISEYDLATVFRFEKKPEKPDDRKVWSKPIVSKLLELEREVFLSGYYKTFLISFDSCGFCETCYADRTKCKNPKAARPGADAMGIDVYSTVHSIGYPIQVLKNYEETMNRYAFLLIE